MLSQLGKIKYLTLLAPVPISITANRMRGTVKIDLPMTILAPVTSKAQE